MPRLTAAVVGLLALTVIARAGLDVPPQPADTSGFVTRAEMPQPAGVVPPAESPQGSPGTPGTYRPGNAVQPRITRSKTVTLDGAGTATFDWTAQGAINTPVQVAIAPIYSGLGAPKCWVTAATGTSASVKCVVETVAILSIVGINVGSVTNSAPTGMQVGVIALPPS